MNAYVLPPPDRCHRAGCGCRTMRCWCILHVQSVQTGLHKGCIVASLSPAVEQISASGVSKQVAEVHAVA